MTSALDERLSDATFTLTRTFDAPRELVWQAFTDHTHMQAWWGPKEVTIIGGSMDFRPGGTYHYGMRSSESGDSWGRFVYREIEPISRIVGINSFSDPAGGITRHPLSAEWPLEMHTIYTFTGQDGKTTLSIQWRALNASATEEKVFADNLDNCRIGWTSSLDQLEAYLTQLQS